MLQTRKKALESLSSKVHSCVSDYPIRQGEVQPHTTTLLIPQCESKTTTNIFEPILNQAVLNAGRVDTGHVHTQDSQRMTMNYISHNVIAHKDKTYKTTYFPSSSNLGQAYILMYFPPLYDQAHPVQLEQTRLFTEVKMHGLLSYMSNSP